MLGVPWAELGAPATGDLDHRGGGVGRDHAAALADERRHLEAAVAWTGARSRTVSARRGSSSVINHSRTGVEVASISARLPGRAPT